ncbi:MAG: S8 family serine peptidase [Anaerolineae bacterium]
MRTIAARIPLVLLVLSFVLTAGPVGAQLSALDFEPTSQYGQAGDDKIAPSVHAAMASLQEGEMTTVIVTLVDQADLSEIPGASRAARQEGVIRALQAKAEASQRQIRALLAARQAKGKVSHVASFWAFNGLAVTATRDVIQELAARADVAKITPDAIEITTTQTAGLPEPNLSVVGAPELWDLGISGQGAVVANMDSGVDVSHPDLSSRWRGGANSWFDPYGEHPDTPVDLSGHGTWTMGVMVGGNEGGTAVGVAPGAEWIAVKIFDDQGGATATAIHQGFQWLLDPDGDPSTPDAPHTVNNSWTMASPGCDLEFELDLQSLRAAGILPVFAAGNGGPDPQTSFSPANNPSAFAVGATDNSDQVYVVSSRGPSGCGEMEMIFPELVAPGVSIHTTDLYGSYTDATGTSLAAPHVAGGLALLLSAFPASSIAEQEAALLNSAVDLGPVGPDNDFGYGRLDLWAAYEWLLNAPTPDPTVNLALNSAVTASSFEDGDHSGEMAVDGDPVTYWMTEKAVGRNKLPSEWITVDLGASVPVGRVVLTWGDYYATSYAIAVSPDGAAWTPVFSTTAGDGGVDSASFGPYSARYVRLESTAWSHDGWRNWLSEFEVYSGGGDPTPTPSPTPTPTPSPTPTPTPTPSPTPTPDPGVTMHIGDLDGSSSANRSRWEAVVVVMVLDANGNPVPDATVDGVWSDGVSGTVSCATDATGACSLSNQDIKKNVSLVIFTVEAISHIEMTYDSSANTDPDGDSDGTQITLPQP